MFICFFFQAEDGIRDLVRSRGLGDVYKRQDLLFSRVGKVPGAASWTQIPPAREVGQPVQSAQHLSLIHI